MDTCYVVRAISITLSASVRILGRTSKNHLSQLTLPFLSILVDVRRFTSVYGTEAGLSTGQSFLRPTALSKRRGFAASDDLGRRQSLMGQVCITCGCNASWPRQLSCGRLALPAGVTLGEGKECDLSSSKIVSWRRQRGSSGEADRKSVDKALWSARASAT
jgi:hypothetical protein